jgi:hypothetical protein
MALMVYSFGCASAITAMKGKYISRRDIMPSFACARRPKSFSAPTSKLPAWLNKKISHFSHAGGRGHEL